MSLRNWRLKNGLTLTEVGSVLSVSIGQLSHLEKGERKWSVELAKQVEAYTKGAVTASSLLGIRDGRRRARGVREESATYDRAETVSVEVALSAQQRKDLTSLGVDVEAVARSGAKKALVEAHSKAWAEQNRDAIEAYNAWIKKHGTLAEQLGLI